MPIIEVSHVTKNFRLGQLHSFTVGLQRLIARMKGDPFPERPNFNALEDVNFTVEPGEVLGIIGSNGAGKSTLLKILSRITIPSSGHVRVNGKVAPMIEVGAGLIGDLTGRENIYLNGAILGMSRKEIAKKFDEIVEFSELEQFLDTPIKRYSSGMSVRLGFSIATSVDAEILIVDEVLAVGDLAFQRKCFDRMENMIRHQQKTVLLVSHNIRQVERLCTRAILLDHGRVIADGKPTETCTMFYPRSDEKIKRDAEHLLTRPRRQQTTGEVELLEVQMVDAVGNSINQVAYNTDVTVVVKCKVKATLKKPVFGLGVHTTDFVYLATDIAEEPTRGADMPPGCYELRCKIKRFPLLPRVYALRLGISAGEFTRPVFYGENIFFFQVVSVAKTRSHAMQEGFIQWQSEWSVEELADAPASASQRNRLLA